MKDSGIGSFAYAHRHELPGEPMRFEKTAPKVRSDFDYNRDPYIAKQMADQGKSEAERRGSFMVKRQSNTNIMRPPLHIGMGPDRAAFNRQWHDEFMAARRSARRDKREYEYQPTPPKPVMNKSFKANALSVFITERKSKGRQKSKARSR